MHNITNSLVDIKHSFKVQDRLMNFKITKHEKLSDTVLDSTWKFIFKKLLLVEF